jgi:Protein of unknown function (DUF4054)
MSFNSWPNFDAWLQTAWGSGAEFWSSFPVALTQGATNLTFGQNPPYCLDDFWAGHPKFFGPACAVAGCALTANSATMGVLSLAGLAPGQFVRAPGLLPKGTVIMSVSGEPVTQVVTHGEVPQGATPGTQFTISAAPLSGVLQSLTWNGVYQTPGVDYALVGNEITTVAAVQPDDTLWATWLIEAQLQPVHGEVPTGAVPGQVFMLSQTPPNNALQTLTANGQFLSPGVDYVLTGASIILSAPLSSGTLYATWLTPVGYSVTLNNAALATTVNGVVQVYEQPPVPLSIVLTYLRLAYASLIHKRWQEEWWVAMGWFIAHYLTLWARSDALEVLQMATSTHGETPVGAVPGTVFTLSTAPPGNALQSLTANGLFLTPGVDYALSGEAVTLTVPLESGALYATWPTAEERLVSSSPTSAQVAAQGLSFGIQTSKSVGDVSVSYQVLTALESWGAWNLTLYGQELATAAAVIGSGPMVIW